MPRGIRLGVAAGIGALVLAGALAWLVVGPAIMLELASGASRLLCL